MNRCEQLMKQLPEKTMAIIPGALSQIRNGDTHYPFRQESDFFYLTHFDEPSAMVILLSSPTPRSILFLRESDPVMEQWDGPRLGISGARALGLWSEVFSINDWSKIVASFMEEVDTLYYPIGKHLQYQQDVLSIWASLKHSSGRMLKGPQVLCDISPLIAEMRVFKEDNEVACLKEAIRYSIAGHLAVMQKTPTLQYEYQVEAEFRYQVAQFGCHTMAYPPIVASGDRACTLHYIANNQALPQDGLLLIDAGAEYQYYAADITRTFPISGQFSGPQRAVYEIVLAAQRAGISAIRPGVLWGQIQEVMVRILTQGLVDLGCLKGSVDDLIETGAYRPFYMHSSGHWLGLDVHDAGVYKKENRWRPLSSGMVLTVEPGLYLSAHLDIPEAFKGIGIRIEDDLLVTDEASLNLSAALPVDIQAIETLMREARDV